MSEGGPKIGDCVRILRGKWRGETGRVLVVSGASVKVDCTDFARWYAFDEVVRVS